jgi:hypothetical protein
VLVVNERDRLSFFDRDGHFVATTRVPWSPTDGIQVVQGISDDCSAALVLSPEPLPNLFSGVHRPHSMMYWADLDGAERDSIVEFRGRETAMVTHAGRTYPYLLPWGIDPVWATDGQAFYLGRAESAQVEVFSRSGRLTEVIRWEDQRRSVGRADRLLYERKRDAYLLTAPQEATFHPPIGAFTELPAAMPPYSELMIDRDGFLWVREYPASAAGQPGMHDDDGTGEPVSWLAFDPARRLVGRIQVPAGVKIRSISGNRLIGVVRNEFDEESIAIFDLEPMH